MRDKKGRITTQFSDDIFIQSLTDEWQSPSDISQRIGCSQSSAQKTLKKLYQSGKIDGMMITNRWLYRLSK